MTLANAKKAVFESPGWKTLFSVLFPIIAGVLASAFVVDISGPAGLEWRSFYHSTSFYILLFLVLIMLVYNSSLYRYERDIRRFLDTDYCTAYMVSECLPELAERTKQEIRQGGVKQFAKAMDEVRKGLR